MTTPLTASGDTRTPLARCDDSLAVDDSLLEILDEFVDLVQRGLPVDRHELISRRPELGDQLQAYFDSLLFLQRAKTGEGGLEVDEVAAADWGGRTLGDYRIVREIARGGMGIVYEAIQTSLDRRVAIKVLPLAGVLDQNHLARFMVEAQAAAQLQHAHIVPVYSVGCERGIHYYSMQLIDGQSLDGLLDEVRDQAGATRGRRRDRETCNSAADETLCRLSTSGSTRSRAYMKSVARLGIQAAEALHHAHGFGVVHRDIKPSNILIDQLGKLWLTDFGLARWQTRGSITLTGDVLGTVRYMSPEQARGRSDLVDRRTDIYSLGITLYEMLTLRKAFAMTERALFLHQIEHQEPRAPRRVNPAIPVDLETIVLKATAKRRGRRYDTARAMADDLRRFLAGEPIQARRPSLADRVSKWAARHRTLVAGGLLMLTLTTLVSSVAAVVVSRQQARTERALETREESLDRANRHFRQARRVVDHFGAHAAERLKEIPGAEQIRRQLLSDTLGYYREFIEQAAGDDGVRADLAVTHFKMAELYERLGSAQQALDSYERSRRILSELVARNPAAVRQSGDLAKCYNNLGLLRASCGDAQQARQAYRRAIDLQQQLIARNRQTAVHERNLALVIGNLALLCSQTGQPREAHSHYREAIAIQQRLLADHPDDATLEYDLAINLNNLSHLHGDGDVAKGLAANGQALELLRGLAAADPQSESYRSDLALALTNRAGLCGRLNRLCEARTAYVEAIGGYQDLVRRAPAVAQYRLELAAARNNLGRMLIQLELLGPAATVLFEARDGLRRLVEQFPNDLRHRSSLGGTANNLGLVREKQGRWDAAVDEYREAVLCQRFCYDRAADVSQYAAFLTTSYENLARALYATGREEEAVEIAQQRSDLQAKLHSANAQGTQTHVKRLGI